MRPKCKLLPATRAVILLLTLLCSLSLIDVVEAALINMKLSGDMVLGGDVLSYQISPDGKYGVFMADARTNTIVELFSVPLAGGGRTRLSGTLPAGSVVQDFLISPDNQKVVYWIQDADGICTGIYLVPISGGAQVNLGVIPEHKKLTLSAITSDSRYFVYVLKHWEYMAEIYDVIWVAPMNGSGTRAITSDPCRDCTITFQVMPADQDILYLLSHSGGPNTLYRATMEGVKIELAIDLNHFQITPDGDRVVYVGYPDWPKRELFSIPSVGGDPVKLSEVMVSEGQVKDFKIAPNSQQVVYRADESVDEHMELFSVPVDGNSIRVKLSGLLIPAGDVQDYLITPNSLGVVYRADQAVDERFDLGAVGIDGGTIYWLNKEMVPGGDVTDFAITPNSLGVVFRADKLVDEKYELFVVSIFGTLLTRLNADLPAGGDVMNFKISPNGQGVLYRADQAVNDIVNLYAVPVTGGATPVRVNDRLTLGGDVHNFVITPDSKGIVYLADQDTDGVDELYGTFDRQIIFLPMAKK